MSCPSCGAAYEIPESVLATGLRRLRCARCAHEWSPTAALQPAPDIAAAPTVRPETAVSPVEPAGIVQDETAAMWPSVPLVASPPLTQERPGLRPRRVAALTLAAWAASLAVLAGLALAAYLFRGTVQAAWPPSRVLYAALGLG